MTWISGDGLGEGVVCEWLEVLAARLQAHDVLFGGCGLGSSFRFMILRLGVDLLC